MGRMFKALLIVPILVIRVPAFAESIDLQDSTASQYITYQQPLATNNASLSELLSIPSFRALDLSQPHDSLVELYEKAPLAQNELENIAHRIAKHVGGNVHSAGLKSEERAHEKVTIELAGDASKLTDIVRITVEVDSIESLTDAYAELTASTQTLEVINRFQSPRPSGYRDLKVLVSLPESQLIAEVQLHLKDIAEIKNGKEHEIYKEIQAIERKPSDVSHELSELELAKIEQLRYQSRHLYDNAWLRYQPLNIAV